MTAAKNVVLPYCQEHGIRLIIADNDSKLHSKGIKEVFHPHKIEIYYGSKKTCGDNGNGYLPRSHDCMSYETVFANVFRLLQDDPERREVSNNCKRIMQMRRNALDKVFDENDIEKVSKIINRQPKVMESIIEVDRERTNFEKKFFSLFLKFFRFFFPEIVPFFSTNVVIFLFLPFKAF